MAGFYLLQAGSSLQTMTTGGVLATLTLPTGVVLDSTKRPRFAVFGRYIVVVNSPTRPITVDPEGTVRLLCPRPPRTRPVLTGPSVGGLSGTFMAWQSFLIWDKDGTIIAESPLGPAALAVTISAKMLQAASLDLSPEAVSASRIYRSVTNGSVPFPWIDIEGNVQTSVLDDLSDTGLQLVTAPTLGSPPDLTMISEFKDRLWGRSRTDIDTLRYTEAGLMYSWPALRKLVVPRIGSDDRGITGILARRDQLAVARQNIIYQVAGDSPTVFRLVRMKEGVGIDAEDSFVIHRDTGYFLAKGGVWAWDDSGLRCLSDGKTANWFTTDTYFNRSMFRYAVGRMHPDQQKYQLFLAAAGSSVLDRWVEYDIHDQTWWGPHKTADFTPTFAANLLDANDNSLPIIASSAGFLYKDQATRTDGTATAIDADMDSKFHDCDSPDIDKIFLQPSLISKIQAAGTLTITPKVGGLDAAADTAITADMTLGRERLPRLGGPGRFVQLNFRHNTVAQDIELYGYEIPWHEAGRR